MARPDYDWIDDAFDSEKEDPLGCVGMTGCSGLAVLVAAIAAAALIAAFFVFGSWVTFLSATGL